MVLDWLRSTAEWKQWGMNALTLSFLATLFFGLLQAWSLTKQIRTIGRLRSGASISVPFFAYMCHVFFVFLCYGLAIDSLAAVLNGLLGFFYVAVLVRLSSYRRFTRLEKGLLALLPVTIVAMLVTTHRDFLLAAVLGSSLLALAHQPYAMYRNRSVGAVEPRFLAVFTGSSLFWTVYAFALDDAVLRIVNPMALAIQFATIALYLAYRTRLKPETL